MKLDQDASCAIGSSNRLGLSGQVRFNEKGLGTGHLQTSCNWMVSSSTHLQVSNSIFLDNVEILLYLRILSNRGLSL